jgi:hypothetical protein
LNADINFNRIKSVFDGDYTNIYNDANATYLMQHGDVSQYLVTSQIDFESNLQSLIWSVHLGSALGVDVEHVEKLCQQAIEESRNTTGGQNAGAKK